MGRSLPLSNAPEAADAGGPLTGSVAVYDPAMCCPTGLCGPGVDPALLALARDLRWLEKQGVTVERFGLSQQPDAYLKQPRVAGLMQAFGARALPVTLVNGELLDHGRYPSREEITAALRGAPTATSPRSTSKPGGCGCAPGSDCC